MRFGRRKCIFGIPILILLGFFHLRKPEFKKESATDLTEIVRETSIAVERSRRLFKRDELSELVKSLNPNSTQIDPTPRLLIVIPCNQEQSAERSLYRKMVANFVDTVSYQITVVFVAFVNGVEHLKRTGEEDLVIVADSWKAEFTDIYCKSDGPVFSTLKITTYLII